MPFATTWMDLVGTALSGVSQTEEDKWNPKKRKKKKKTFNTKLIDTEKGLVVARGGGGRRVKWVKVTKR